MEQKYCRYCRTRKDVSEFYNNRKAADGKMAICKECYRKRQQVERSKRSTTKKTHEQITERFHGNHDGDEETMEINGKRKIDFRPMLQVIIKSGDIITDTRAQVAPWMRRKGG